jgi:hypothetical protein
VLLLGPVVQIDGGDEGWSGVLGELEDLVQGVVHGVLKQRLDDFLFKGGHVSRDLSVDVVVLHPELQLSNTHKSTNKEGSHHTPLTK